MNRMYAAARDDGFFAEVMDDLVGLTDLEIEALLRETV